MKKPGILTGALAGALLTGALIAILSLASRVAGVPFVPFDIFDWTARALPGAVVTFGIDTMVGLIRTFELGEISTAAKTAEQMMAIMGPWLAGIVAGAVLFAVLRRWEKRPAYLPGLLLGGAVALLVLLIRASLGQPAPAGPIISALWIVAAFLGWGAALTWAYNRLAAAPAGDEEQRAEVYGIDRRSFMIRLGGATAVITIAGAGLGRWAARGAERVRGEPWSATHRLSNAGADVRPAPGTRPEFTPVAEHYRIDINTSPPVIPEAEWRLSISGLVEQPREFTLAQLQRYPAMDQFITLRCISNPIGGDLISTQRWTGVSMQRFLPELGLTPSATHLHMRSADGYDEVVSIEEINADERIMLAYAWDGLPLPTEHGFPLRIYIPNVYGMKQPKWIESIEAIDHWVPGYWVRRGWDREAVMKAVSVIDTVATDMMMIEADENMRIPIGGIAHAGARGVSKVEVRVDDGPWREAELREPLSGLTWVIWRYDWPFREGSHTFTVRCFDGDGTPQIAETTPVRPDGATGLDSETAML